MELAPSSLKKFPRGAETEREPVVVGLTSKTRAVPKRNDGRSNKSLAVSLARSVSATNFKPWTHSELSARKIKVCVK